MGNYDIEKTIVVPDSNPGGTCNNFLAGMLASACQSKGLDASSVMALCNGRNGGLGNFGINEIIALVVIAALFGGNGNGTLRTEKIPPILISERDKHTTKGIWVMLNQHSPF